MSLKSTGLILAMILEFGLLELAAQTAVAKGRQAHSPKPDPSTGSTFIPAPRGFGTVKAAMSQFNYALAMHDVGMLEAAGVDQEGAKRWNKFFSENPLATVADDCPASELFAAEERAFWTCTETVTVISDGRPQAFYHLIQFTFGKKNGMWKVYRRRLVGDLDDQQGGSASWP
jgi:hypothetical protein